jgi:hypothetical protein
MTRLYHASANNRNDKSSLLAGKEIAITTIQVGKPGINVMLIATRMNTDKDWQN